MAKIEAFTSRLRKAKRVGIDSSCFIYKFEQHPLFEKPTSVIFELLSQNKIEVVTSVVTVAEVLAKPLEKKDFEVVSLYETVFLQLPNFQLLNLDYHLARLASEIRAKYRIRLPDAFQIACCLEAGVKVFVTNDKSLKKVKEIEVLVLKDFIQ